ncbi:uncharacterized protein LOC132786534 [Drosophila nasuta]|uniref:uncharacterized protein LOC132786534 n=1 Tax=Drosophila nasuta TaxID=42062 RepID=UPI00295E91AF|nr:uncharacterized protein LOC132786534 [Drosophila nasuta]
MLPSSICGYNPKPENYFNWLSPLHAERLNRITLRSLQKEKRTQPLLLMLHLFADDLDGLKTWLDIFYDVAGTYDNKIRFYVDDLWAAYVFQWNDFSIRRGDSSFTLKSPPLIYGVSATGEVHFFGNAAGPTLPSLQKLKVFCSQLLTESLGKSLTIEETVKVADVELSTFNDLIYGEDQNDIIVCFYSSVSESSEVLNDLERLAAKLQHEKISIYKKSIQFENPPKRFNVKTSPTLFLLPRDHKHNPIRCYDLLRGVSNLLKFVALHSTEELNFYDRHGIRKVHVELLKQIRNNFKEGSMGFLRY